MTDWRAKSAVLLLAALMVLHSPGSSAIASGSKSQKSLSDGSSDEQEIRKQAELFCRAFQIGDAGIIADMWSEDGTLTDSSGKEYSGRAAIRKAYEDFFHDNGAQRIKVAIDNIRFPASNIAIEDGISSLPQNGSSLSRYTVVHVKRNGKWQMMSVVESPAVTDSHVDTLKDLNWLVGDWTAKGKDASVPFQAQWIANQNFLRCVYFTDDKDQSVKGMKIFGWDPIRGKIRTWHFASDGSYGFGTLEKQGPDWLERAQSVQADGSQSSATYVLTPKDNGTFTWQSTHRLVDGAELPDTGVVDIVRNK